MDFKLTEKQAALKKEFEAFFKEEMKHAPPEYGRGGLEGMYDTEEGFRFHQKIARKLGEKGWLSRAWPKEVGGEGAPVMEQLLFNDYNE